VVVKVVPSLLPITDNVCVLAGQVVEGGKSSVIFATVVGAPRSTCNHCGRALFVLSQ
jgi:hypothetical protein